MLKYLGENEENILSKECDIYLFRMNSDEFSKFQVPVILYVRNLGDEMPRNDVNKLLKDFHLSSCSHILRVLV